MFVLSVVYANLDGDQADELLVCGTDASGGWFAVVHLDGDGALPSDSQQAIRSWEGGAYVEPADQRFACVVGDIDNDGAQRFGGARRQAKRLSQPGAAPRHR